MVRAVLGLMLAEGALAVASLFVALPAVAQNAKCGGGAGYWFTNDRQRNPQPGGWVAAGASVDESSEIAPTAQVCGSAVVRGSKVLGNSVISGDAIVEGSTLQGHAKVGGDAIVRRATLRGYFEIFTGELEEGIHGAAFSNSEARARLSRLRGQIATTRTKLARLDADAAALRGRVSRVDTSTAAFRRAKTIKEQCYDTWRKVEGIAWLVPPRTWDMVCPEVKWVRKIDGREHIDEREISKVRSAMHPYNDYFDDMKALKQVDSERAKVRATLTGYEREAARLEAMLR